MCSQPNQAANDCPVTRASVAAEAKAAFDHLVAYCETCDSPFLAVRERPARPHRGPGVLLDSAVSHGAPRTPGRAALPRGWRLSSWRRVFRTHAEDVVRRGEIWPAILDGAMGRRRLLSARQGAGSSVDRCKVLGFRVFAPSRPR